MKGAWSGKGMLCAVVLAAALIPLEVCAAETKSYPVVFACLWEESEEPGVWLLGAFEGGVWLDRAVLPVKVDGQEMTHSESEEFSEPVVCSVPLLEKGKKLVFYSADGRKIGVATVMETRYSQSAASGEIFIDVLVHEGGAVLPPRVPSIGVGTGYAGGAEPRALSVTRAADKERITFSAVDGENPPILADFSLSADGYGERAWRGTVTRGGKSWILDDVYLDPRNPPEGFFIDMNGDDRPEFALYSYGIAAFVTVWDLQDDGAKEVLILDLGD